MRSFDFGSIERGDSEHRVLRLARLHSRLEKNLVATLVEWAMWAALLHVIAGVVYTGLHVEVMTQLEHHLGGRFAPFGDLAALGSMILLWPLFLASAWLCGVTGCGLVT